MKHALVLFSSPHKDGHTKKLLEAFLDGLKGEDWQVKLLDICNVNIHPVSPADVAKKQTAARFATSMNSIVTYARVICLSSPRRSITSRFRRSSRRSSTVFSGILKLDLPAVSARRLRHTAMPFCCSPWGGMIRLRWRYARKHCAKAFPL